MPSRRSPSSRSSSAKTPASNGARRKALAPLTGRLESPLDLERHLPYRLAILSNLLLVDRDPLVRGITDLGLKELRVLLNVGSYMPVRAADIAYQTRMGAFTVSRAVKALLEAGWIETEQHQLDARAALLQLTPRGRKLYATLAQLLEKRATRIAAVLTQEEQAQLLGMLARLEDNAEKVLAEEALESQKKRGRLTVEQKELLRWFKRSKAG